jgi:hypothetical protein
MIGAYLLLGATARRLESLRVVRRDRLTAFLALSAFTAFPSGDGMMHGH